MIYAAARPLIKSGDLLFFRGTGAEAAIVRDWTHSPYSHVGLAWRAGDRILVLESRPVHGGVTIDRTLSNALPDGVTWMPMDGPWTPAMESRALAHLGVGYSVTNSIRAGLRLRVQGPALECAEYVSLVLGEAYAEDETPASLAARFRHVPVYQIWPPHNRTLPKR